MRYYLQQLYSMSNSDCSQELLHKWSSSTVPRRFSHRTIPCLGSPSVTAAAAAAAACCLLPCARGALCWSSFRGRQCIICIELSAVTRRAGDDGEEQVRCSKWDWQWSSSVELRSYWSNPYLISSFKKIGMILIKYQKILGEKKSGTKREQKTKE